MFAMNLVTRDDEIADKVKQTLARHFQAVYNISSDEDVNEVGYIFIFQGSNYCLDINMKARNFIFISFSWNIQLDFLKRNLLF